MYQDATNLFARLSRYSLKPKKSPLENFCTELLAWCLQKSVGFQSEFLKLIQLDFLKNLKGAIEIRTQQYWIDKEDDQDENGDEDHKERPRGFFDLEFQSPQDLNGQGELFIAIESKIGADFKPGQLPKYRAELAKRGANYNHCYLITLTTRSKKPGASKYVATATRPGGSRSSSPRWSASVTGLLSGTPGASPTS